MLTEGSSLLGCGTVTQGWVALLSFLPESSMLCSPALGPWLLHCNKCHSDSGRCLCTYSLPIMTVVLSATGKVTCRVSRLPSPLSHFLSSVCHPLPQSLCLVFPDYYPPKCSWDFCLSKRSPQWQGHPKGKNYASWTSRCGDSCWGPGNRGSARPPRGAAWLSISRSGQFRLCGRTKINT